MEIPRLVGVLGGLWGSGLVSAAMCGVVVAVDYVSPVPPRLGPLWWTKLLATFVALIAACVLQNFVWIYATARYPTSCRSFYLSMLCSLGRGGIIAAKGL